MIVRVLTDCNINYCLADLRSSFGYITTLARSQLLYNDGGSLCYVFLQVLMFNIGCKRSHRHVCSAGGLSHLQSSADHSTSGASTCVTYVVGLRALFSVTRMFRLPASEMRCHDMRGPKRRTLAFLECTAYDCGNVPQKHFDLES